MSEVATPHGSARAWAAEGTVRQRTEAGAAHSEPRVTMTSTAFTR